MAIEFTCSQCDHLLRTGDDKAGLSATCPACGAALWVPYPPEEGGVPAADDVDAEVVEPGDVFEFEWDDVPPPAADDGAVPPGEETSQATSEQPADGAHVEASEIDCPNCYTSNDPGAAHCRICGESLEGVEPVAAPAWNAPVPDVGEAMSTTWRIYQDRMGLLVGSGLLLMLLFVVLYMVAYFGFFAVALGLGQIADELAIVAMVGGMFFLFVAYLFLAAVTMIGVSRLNLRVAKGEPAEISDLFYGLGEGRRLIPGMLLIAPALGIVQAVTAGIGLMFFWPLPLYYVDRQLPIGETVSSFFEQLGASIGFVVLIGLVAFGINLGTVFLVYCCIGVLVMIFSTPYLLLLYAVSYLRMTRQKTAIDQFH